MQYKLTIIKYEKNENYEAEVAKFKEDRNYGYANRMEPAHEDPHREIAQRSLEVFLTEEEYKKVKEEVLKVFQ